MIISYDLSPLLVCKLQEDRGFCLCWSLSFPKHLQQFLVQNRCSINICLMKEKLGIVSYSKVYGDFLKSRVRGWKLRGGVLL